MLKNVKSFGSGLPLGIFFTGSRDFLSVNSWDISFMHKLAKHSAMQLLSRSFLLRSLDLPYISCKSGSMFQFPAFQQPNCFEHPLSSYSTGHLKPPSQALAPDSGIRQGSDKVTVNCVIRRKRTSIIQY